MNCVCGCGLDLETAPRPGSMWRNGWDYWAWMCPNTSCPRWLAEWCNQDGDPACQHCGRKRQLVGHFRGGENSGGMRVTVTGERIRRRHAHEFYWKQNPYIATDPNSAHELAAKEQE